MDVSITCNIKQEGFQNGIFSFLETFRKQKHFLDVSLNCKDGDLQAHRIVLSLYSPFFYDTLKESNDNPSAVPLENVPVGIMEALLKFMYEGEVKLSVSLIHEFLKIGQELEISGFPSREEKAKDDYSSCSKDAGLADIEGGDTTKKTSLVSVDEGFEFEPDMNLERNEFDVIPHTPSEISYVEGDYFEEEENASRSTESPRFLEFQA